MKTIFTALVAALGFAALAAQNNLLTGNVGDYGLAAKSNVAVTATLLWPNPRTDGLFLVRQDPVKTTSGTNGVFYFTNFLWGRYSLVLGAQGTPFLFYVGTNTLGTVALASLVTNAAALPPNPATNYYTIAQADAIHAAMTNATTVGVVGNNGIVCTTNSGVVTCGLYTAPSVSAFTNNVASGSGVVEVGTSVTNPILGWTLAGATVTTQWLNQTIGNVGTLRAYTNTGTFTSTTDTPPYSPRTYTLTVSDGTTTAAGNTSIYWRHRRFWGTTNLTSLNNDQILAMGGELATDQNKSFTVFPNFAYTYYIHPASWKDTTFTVESQPNTAWYRTEQFVTNSVSHRERYYVYRSIDTYYRPQGLSMAAMVNPTGIP